MGKRLKDHFTSKEKFEAATALRKWCEEHKNSGESRVRSWDVVAERVAQGSGIAIRRINYSRMRGLFDMIGEQFHDFVERGSPGVSAEAERRIVKQLEARVEQLEADGINQADHLINIYNHLSDLMRSLGEDPVRMPESARS